MAIRVWTPSVVAVASHKSRAPQARPQRPKLISRRQPEPPTPEQIKEARRKKSKVTEAKARAVYTSIREGRPVQEIVAQGFTSQQVAKYLRQHTRKYRRWRRALWLFEGGAQPDGLPGLVHASRAKAVRWYTHWQANGTALPAVIPTGCEGIQ